MILFHNEQDRMMFMSELGKAPADPDTQGDHSDFIKRRTPIVGLLKNFNKSQASKRQWSRSRFQTMFSMRKYARSIEGRKFHRRLGTFNATHSTRGPVTTMPQREELIDLRANLLLESLYYHSAVEQAEIEWLIEELSTEIIMLGT